MSEGSFVPSKQLRAEAGAPSEHKASEAARVLSYCSSAEARSCLTFTQAEQLEALPLGIIRFSDGEMLSVAAKSDSDSELTQKLQFVTGRRVRLISADPAALIEAIFYAYKGDDACLQRSIVQAGASAGLRSSAQSPAQIEFRPGGGGAAEALASVIDYAVSKGASDVHLIPVRNGGCIRMRVNGELLSSEQGAFSLQLHTQMVSRLKVLASLNSTHRALPQDGSFSFPVSQRQIAARVSIMPTIHGEKAAIRLIGTRSILALDELGLDSAALSFLRRCLDARRGMVLFCGPTGSGKTTSMYSSLDHLRRAALNIVTIEDPVEVPIEGVSQTSVKEDQGLGFEVCLRSALRQDPDVILIGEIRDQNSARIAFHAAMTGHLLLTTVHAREALEVFIRLKHLGLDSSTVSQGLTLIVRQQLLPALCDSCKVVDLAATRACGFEVSREVGCEKCAYSGFHARVPATEIVLVDASLRRVLEDGGLSPEHLSGTLNSGNYLPFEHSLDRLLRNGRISVKQLKNA